ncbi:MAG TPA: HlyD family type I secretion periplasmic adaptor subunit [Stellaceae bacterium]
MTAIGSGALTLMRRVTRRRDPAIDIFQSDATELENAGPAPVARITLFAATALIAAIIAWASLARVDEIVTGKGKVISSAMNMVIAPLSTATIRSIDVRVGDIVGAGQPLAHLDSTFTQADVAEQTRHKASLDAQIARMATELAGRVYRPAAAPTPDRMLQAGLSLYRDQQYRAQLRSFDEHAAQLMAQIAQRTEQIVLMRQRLTVLIDLETMRRKLSERGNGSKVDLLNAEATRLDVERAIAEASGEIAALRHEIASGRGDRDSFVRKWREDLIKDLVTARHDDVTATELLAKDLRARAMAVLTSPGKAVVLEIADRTAGSVVREAEPLITLVPLDRPTEIEVSVDTADIGHLKAGEEARIKLDAFPYQRFGTLTGKVAVISGDSFVADKGGKDGAGGEAKPYYRVRIALDGGKRLRNVPADFQLIPGMTTTAEIKSGSRRLISYLLYPLTRGFDEAFREP